MTYARWHFNPRQKQEGERQGEQGQMLLRNTVTVGRFIVIINMQVLHYTVNRLLFHPYTDSA